MTAIDRRRAFATLLVAAAGGWLLLQVPAPAARPTEFGDLLAWWDSVGTDAAAMSVARLVMLSTCGYVAAVSSLALVAVPLQVFRIRLPWQRIALPSLRRHLGGAAIVAVTLAPSLATAQDAGQFTARDIGRSSAAAELVSNFAIADIGPSGAADTEVDSLPTPQTLSWTVQPGDHLWGIASAQVSAARDAGLDIELTNQTIATYWTRLIDANSDVLNNNPDIILVGQVLALPPVPDR